LLHIGRIQAEMGRLTAGLDEMLRLKREGAA
jgi:hypothetical protein